ncbi:MAG: zinc-dependent alcohol dehydrogenase family protein [Hyphomonas oceanitis]|uniref:zinc-dependent alcohol dehydrogenase family protein n=1 Tax=Hyphomonas oceanitis TaxID=81033 RepID=UPI0030036A66
MENTALIYRRFGPPSEALKLERLPLSPRPPHLLRVKMQMAPVNPSDLIPITGAYAHRVSPPLVAGYEGVGEVIAAPVSHAHLIGKRVLPLRGPGTWQAYVDCDPDLAIPVPPSIDSTIAARGYINPLAAQLMLDAWPVKGTHVMLTAAGSTCATLLAQWALAAGASRVTGVYRAPEHKSALTRRGVEAIQLCDADQLTAAAASADVTFDALGGEPGSLILKAMPADADFVSYGLLTGQPVLPGNPRPRAHHRRFHMRDSLAAMTPQQWHACFDTLWPRLNIPALPAIREVRLEDWQDALAGYDQPRRPKPILILGDAA